MSKKKKNKGSKSRTAKLSSMVAKASQGFNRNSHNTYSEFGDYDPSKTDQRSFVRDRSGRRINKSSARDANAWAGVLVLSGGKRAGDVFKMNNKMYKIATSRSGTTATEVKV